MSEPIVTEAHLLGFGMVTHYYAYAEMGIRVALAEVSSVSGPVMLALTEPLPARQLRAVAKSVAKLSSDPARTESFVNLVGTLGGFSKLRNHIAHSRWVAGSRPGSIKPSGIDVMEGRIRLLGIDASEPDWLAKELWSKGNELARLAQRISAFLKEGGAADSIATSISDGSNPTVSSDHASS